MALHKKQHYIPQCYLKMFSDNNTHIWAYDKISKKSYGVLISDVCTANNFYTISDSFIKENNKLNHLQLRKISLLKNMSLNLQRNYFIYNN